MKSTRKSQRRSQKKAKQARRCPRRKLKAAIRSFLPDSIFANVKKHGNTNWSLCVLPFVALLWGLSGESTLGERFCMATDVAVHWFPGQFIATTYRGFIGALVTHNAVLVRVVSEQLRRHMTKLEKKNQQVAGLIPFAVDGTKIAAPWTKSNEQQLGKKGRKPKGEKCQRKNSDLRPQLSLTLVWHMSLALPWAWKHGGLCDSERSQFRELLGQLPTLALVVADAGFVGYLFWQTIINSGRHFLIRVGGNVELLRGLLPGDAELERHGDFVWLWPDRERNQQRPPLKLRLIKVQRGREAWYLVTSILDPEKLTEAQAAKLYARRWGIECCFRTLKQTFERGKVRSYTPACAASELDWSLLSLWLISLLAKQELIGVQIDPDSSSAAGVRRLVRRELRFQCSGQEQLNISDLQAAVKDLYNRKSSKKARHDQRKKRDPPPKGPKIAKASKVQRQAAKAIEQSKAPAA